MTKDEKPDLRFRLLALSKAAGPHKHGPAVHTDSGEGPRSRTSHCTVPLPKSAARKTGVTLNMARLSGFASPNGEKIRKKCAESRKNAGKTAPGGVSRTETSGFRSGKRRSTHGPEATDSFGQRRVGGEEAPNIREADIHGGKRIPAEFLDIPARHALFTILEDFQGIGYAVGLPVDFGGKGVCGKFALS